MIEVSIQFNKTTRKSKESVLPYLQKVALNADDDDDNDDDDGAVLLCVFIGLYLTRFVLTGSLFSTFFILILFSSHINTTIHSQFTSPFRKDLNSIQFKLDDDGV